MVLLNFLIEMCINEFNDNQQVKRLSIDLYLIIPKAVEVICVKALCYETVTNNIGFERQKNYQESVYYGRKIYIARYIENGRNYGLYTWKSLASPNALSEMLSTMDTGKNLKQVYDLV